MTEQNEFANKLWKALKSDRTVMLGLDSIENGHARPMTAQFENDQSPIWFFTSTENGIVKSLGQGKNNQATATFASKGHDLFATVKGLLVVDKDPAVIDRLWNSFVAAWYEGGKSDPKLTLLRFDAKSAEVWIDASSLVAGVKLLIGIDPKQEYKDKKAHLDLRQAS